MMMIVMMTQKNSMVIMTMISVSSDNFSQTSDVETGEQKMQLDDVISEEGLSIGNEYKKTSGGDRKQPSTQIVYHPDDG